VDYQLLLLCRLVDSQRLTRGSIEISQLGSRQLSPKPNADKPTIVPVLFLQLPSSASISRHKEPATAPAARARREIIIKGRYLFGILKERAFVVLHGVVLHTTLGTMHPMSRIIL